MTDEEFLRPYGYAPGGYYCHCRGCEGTFTGDKRATRCHTCAMEAFETHATIPKPTETTANYAILRVALRHAIQRVVGLRVNDIAVIYRGIEDGSLNLGDATDKLESLIGDIHTDEYITGVSDGR